MYTVEVIFNNEIEQRERVVTFEEVVNYYTEGGILTINFDDLVSYHYTMHTIARIKTTYVK
jgi:hypothetical protein